MARDLHPDDDGRTIADMSGVGGPAPEPLSQGSRDVREELGGTEEQVMVLLGTLKAGLSIGAVYIVVFGIVIAIMVALWT
jgi:hypothetical protein